MTKRRKVIRAFWVAFFAILPQLLIWLHSNGHGWAVTLLCLLYATIHIGVALKFLTSIVVYSLPGIALFARPRRTKSLFAVLLGSLHIVYALYRVGWHWLATSYLLMILLYQVLLFSGRKRLSRMDKETVATLQAFIDERMKQAEGAQALSS